MRGTVIVNGSMTPLPPGMTIDNWAPCPGKVAHEPMSVGFWLAGDAQQATAGGEHSPMGLIGAGAPNGRPVPLIVMRSRALVLPGGGQLLARRLLLPAGVADLDGGAHGRLLDGGIAPQPSGNEHASPDEDDREVKESAAHPAPPALGNASGPAWRLGSRGPYARGPVAGVEHLLT